MFGFGKSFGRDQDITQIMVHVSQTLSALGSSLRSGRQGFVDLTCKEIATFGFVQSSRLPRSHSQTQQAPRFFAVVRRTIGILECQCAVYF